MIDSDLSTNIEIEIGHCVMYGSEQVRVLNLIRYIIVLVECITVEESREKSTFFHVDLVSSFVNYFPSIVLFNRYENDIF